MSREFLFDILEQFAKVTSIIVETSKIKEDLDRSENADLNDILERTKIQVYNLFEHATSVKTLLNQSKDTSEVTVKDVNANTSEQSDLTSENIKSEEEKTVNKPLIKLVDINKLVEPRTLPDHKVEKTEVSVEDSVVIITSSDDESCEVSKAFRKDLENSKKNKSSKKGKTNFENNRKIMRRKAAEETIKKTKMFLQTNTSSDSESNLNAPICCKNKNLKHSKRKGKELEKVKLSEDSNFSDNSLHSDSVQPSTNNKKTKSLDQQNECIEYKRQSESLWKNDPKYNFKCYVKVVRVPCEKLKEYYLEKLELLEINKLQDLSSLKRKRRKSNSENSTSNESTSSKKFTENVSNQCKKKKVQLNDSDSTDSDLDEPAIKDSAFTPTVNSVTTNAKVADELAEEALNLLNSDKENVDDQSNSSDIETLKDNEKKILTHSRPAEHDASKNDVTTDTLHANKEQNPSEAVEEPKAGDDSLEQTKKDDDRVNKKDNSAENSTDKNENTSDNDLQSDELTYNKKKKSWKKDKLLTMKLSSSESEEEFEKFKRKKEKMQQEVSSDDEIKINQPKDHKKRIVKRRLKKAILSDSDSDAKEENHDDSQRKSSSSESEKEVEKEEKEPEKTKRKRVKRVSDSSDDEEKSTRKQIRNIWGRDSLAETTKQAEAEEKERKARIAEKQKKYNQIYESSSELNAKVEKVILDFDEKNNQELLKVDDRLVAKLKPHQASGVQFMWDTCFESLERAKSTKGSGCILAHCMGLGKTLQVITLSHTLLVNSDKTNVKKILVVSPLNTVLNWVSEFKQWVPEEDDVEVYELVSYKQNFERQYQVKTWHTHGGVLIIGYDMFRNLSNPENKRLSKKMRSIFQEALVNPGPDLVVCDEGHLLKNEKTNTSIAMNRIKTLRRIVLTGTPLQNNLKEYFCMVQFIKPNLLGTYKEYLNRFVNPITNGQYTDSTPHDIQIMRKRSHVLHKMLDGVVQRRDYSVLEPYLPPKHEYVLFLKLSDTQIKLYTHYMEHFARKSTDGSNRTSFLFIDFQALQRICTHPRVLLDKSMEMKIAKDKKEEEESEGSLKDFINDDDEDETTSSSNSSSDEDNTKLSAAPKKRLTRAAAAAAKENGDSDLETIEFVAPEDKEWWQKYCDGVELDVIGHSSKLFLLFEILKECEQIGDKVLVFSQSLYSLNVIEYFLEKIHDATQAGDTDSVGGYSGSWCLGLDYFRLDGSSSCDNRSTWCKTFNNPTNTQARLFLISTRAGGLGINLVAANRVIIFDVSWNPSHDIQSIYRVYRFGQTKPCYIYRFVTLGTMEMKIYERQVTKQAISKRVIDEQQIDRHYNQNDLAELYRFDPDPGERPIPLVPKDVLLGELLQKYENRIYKYHEHQSLLENKEGECLNEEERKAAWEEFENEKKQRTYISGNYVQTGFIELALASIIRKENPNWTDVQIRAMLPTLHAQMQEQVSRGDLILYKRVQHEISILQALQAQRLKDQFYQQQMIRALQQQQQMESLKLQNAGAWMNQFRNQNQMPGTSQTPNNANDIIDLND